MIKIYAEKYLTAEDLIHLKKNSEKIKKAYLAYEEEGEEVETWTRIEIPLKVARRLLSKRMLELLHLLSQRGEYSISELARTLQRSTPNVHRDLVFLKRYGLITIIEKGHEKTPILLLRKIIIDIR